MFNNGKFYSETPLQAFQSGLCRKRLLRKCFFTTWMELLIASFHAELTAVCALTNTKKAFSNHS